MGGNLFKNSTRHNTSYLKEKEDSIKNLLSSYGVIAYSIPYLSEKETHGDLDLIVVSETFTEHVMYSLIDKFKYAINGKHVNMKQIPWDDAKDIYNRLDIFSFDYDSLHVDLIMIPEQSCEFAVKYHSFNDLGGIIGCITKQMGYSLGREGLFYEHVPIDGYGKHKVYLTTDFFTFCEVFELDDSIYRGENDLSNVNEMFEYLKNWKYFNSDWMNPQLMNATRRNRAAKRKIFNEITTLCHEEGGVKNFDANPYPDLMVHFDKDWIEEQHKENYKKSYVLKDKKYAMSLDRMTKVLGYTPDNASHIFMLISNMFGGNAYAKEHLYNISDEEFKQLLLDIKEDMK